MAMFLYSLTVLWFDQAGYEDLKFPHRPWYTRKTEPSFADMLTTLRRVSWEERFSQVPSDSTLSDNNLNLLTYLATLVG
ncbi:MAG: hypothetical protein KDA84_05155 [Planctomycetaceae bacterium]|nr:hypothetical protein [Planctomycetaceae bacterium]